MIVAYILFILFPQNLALVYVALVLFYTPNTFIQMTAILALTDSIEYGQLKTGQRNKAVTLSVRPMLDKIAGALSNSIVVRLLLLPLWPTVLILIASPRRTFRRSTRLLSMYRSPLLCARSSHSSSRFLSLRRNTRRL